MKKLFLTILATLALATVTAKATTYTDTVDTDHYGNAAVDISSVVLNNDASTLTFQVNLNTAAVLTTDHFAHYQFGIQVGGGAGGQTAINGTFGTGVPAAGNPYGNAVGISSGENFFIGTFLDASGLTGGAQLYSYASATGWTQLGANAPLTVVPTVTPSIAFSFSLVSLGLSAGNSFNFDVWTSFGSPQAAYDALDNASTPPGIAPFNAGALYDSATAAGSTLATYTVVVPEPASCVLLGMGALVLVRRAFRRSA